MTTDGPRRGGPAVAEIARRNSGRATPQRVAVLEALLTSAEHLSAQSILDDCTRAGVRMRLSTVYRVLAAFEEAGLLHAVPTPAGMAYGPTGDASHIHALCLSCSTVLDVTLDNAEELRVPTPFTTSRSSLMVVGCCRDCAVGHALAVEDGR